jgi:hypothetical protein
MDNQPPAVLNLNGQQTVLGRDAGGGTYTCNATCYDNQANLGASAQQAKETCCTGLGDSPSTTNANNRAGVDAPVNSSNGDGTDIVTSLPFNGGGPGSGLEFIPPSFNILPQNGNNGGQFFNNAVGIR